MDNDLMIERLKKAGLCFDKGLSDIEIKEVERNSKRKRIALRCAFFFWFEYRSIRKHGGGEISVARVGEKNDDILSLVFGALGDLRCRVKRRTRRNTDKNAFTSRKISACFVGFFTAYREHLVINFGVQDRRNEVCADTLQGVCAGFSARKKRGIRRLNGDDFDIGIFRFEIFANACDRTARANACDENVDFAVGIVPNLGSRGDRKSVV